MAPVLYSMSLSPPVRAVLLTSRALGIELELKEINLMAGDHLKPEYLKMNPQHTIPTLDDDGFILWDSHAICAYLVGKYGKDDTLYPKDLKKRALIDQRMHFNSGLLFPQLRAIFESVLFLGEKQIHQQKLDAVSKTLSFLESFLEGKEWMTGDKMTLADLCIVASFSCVEIVANILDPAKYPKLITWYEKCKTLPYYEEANGTGVKSLETLFKAKMQI